MAIMLLLLLIQTTLIELAHLLVAYYCILFQDPKFHSPSVTPTSEAPQCWYLLLDNTGYTNIETTLFA